MRVWSAWLSRIARRLVVFGLLVASEVVGGELPRVQRVESQPLLAQMGRLRTAMRTIGTPLPKEIEDGLEQLRGQAVPDDARTAAEVQNLLDPLCLTAVEIPLEGRLKVVPRPGRHELIEQGWRSYLVKVVNRPGRVGRLRVDSPNARPLPHAPSAEVASRWLSLDQYEGQPMKADLGGLELEYRIIQLSARDVGLREAVLEFNVSSPNARPGEPANSAIIKQWRFDRGTDGWKPLNQIRLEPRDGALWVQGTGEDPFMVADVTARPGNLVLRFWARAEQSGVGQVFWWTRQRPQPDGGHLVNFLVQAGQAKLYEVPFTADGDLTGVRIDPDGKASTMRIDWIELAHADKGGEDWTTAALAFEARPATVVTFQVRDGDDPDPMAAFLIRDEAGRVYPALQKRLAPDFFFQPQVYRASGETVHLPEGRYTVVCSRGPESIAESRPLVVGREPVTFTYSVKRWIDTKSLSYWSGDHHIHAAGCLHYENPTQGVNPEDMIRHTRGEDLKVGCCLTWGPCFDFQKRFFTGEVASISRLPYLLRYDVEVSGFGSHISGHLNLLKLKEQIYPGGESKEHWPTLGLNTLRWAKRQGAVCGPAHSSLGLTRFVDRVPGTELMDGPDGLPTYQVPAYDGIGANEFIMQVTHELPGPDGRLVPAVDFISTMNSERRAEWNMWYHVLNCGFRVRASGETDFPCMSGDRVGIGRVYVELDGPVDFDRWVDGLQAGRSYVSDGSVHLMELAAQSAGRRAELGIQGSELALDQPGEIELTLQTAARKPGAVQFPIEVVVNGFPVSKREIPGDGQVQPMRFTVKVERSSWIAVRSGLSAHTNPIFVVVGGKPIRVSRQSADWCLRGVEECWKQKQPSYHRDEQEQARRDYDHAREVYRRIAAESPALVPASR